MKLKQLIFLMVTALTLCACGEDDAPSDAIVEMGQEAIVVKENVEYMYVPLKAIGSHGDIAVNIEVDTPAENAAIDGQHYIITAQQLRIPAEVDSINVEIRIIDDEQINPNRQFTLRLASVSGAQLGSKTLTNITLRDNDASFYERFFGTWLFTAKLANIGGDAQTVSQEIKITGENDETARDYNSVLTASGTDFINIGIDLNCVWHFRYSFNTEQKRGTLAFIMDEEIASYGDVYAWVWKRDEDYTFSSTDLIATWELGVNDSFPDEIEFGEENTLYFFQSKPTKQPYRAFYDVKIVRKR